MKKLLISFFLLWATIAQARYIGAVEIGGTIHTEKLHRPTTSIHILNGVQFGQHFALSAGTGFDFVDSNRRAQNNMLVIPLYLNLKAFIPLGRFTELYASFDIGSGVNVAKPINGQTMFYCTPGFGFRIKTNSRYSLYLSCGYNIHRAWEFYTVDYGEVIGEENIFYNRSGLQLKIGFGF